MNHLPMHHFRRLPFGNASKGLLRCKRLDLYVRAGHLPAMTAYNISRISKRTPITALNHPAVAVAVALAVLSAYGQSKTPEKSTPASRADIAYGTKTSFGIGGKSESLRISGWSGTEREFTWTEGTSAVLAMQVSPTKNPITLKMKLAGLTKDPEL